MQNYYLNFKRFKKIRIIAAAGVNSSNVLDIVDKSSIGDIHIGSGCTTMIESEMTIRKNDVNMGKEINKEYLIKRISKEKVEEINRIAQNDNKKIN